MTSYNKYKQAYLDFMVTVSTTLGANQAVAMNDMEAVLEFETKLANVSKSALNA